MFWDKFRKSDPQPVEPSAEEVAASQQALRRLGRVVERRRDEQAEALAGAAQVASAVLQRFAGNAFLILDVAMDAAAGKIAEAVDELSFAMDGNPAELETARAELLAPRDRLRHELAWFPGCSPEQEQRLRAALKSEDRVALGAVRPSLGGLARINLGVAMIAAGAHDPALIRSVLDDAMRWDAGDTLDRIDESRLRAGLRETDPDHFREGIAARRREIAAALTEHLIDSREGRVLLGEFFDEHAAAILAARAPLLEQLARAYEQLAEPRLQRVRNGIEDHLARLQATATNPASVTAIVTALDIWAQLRKPLQKLEQARGLDDPASADLFAKIREVAVTLSNEHQLHDDSLRLTRGLAHGFASVPSLHAKVASELPVVIGNVLHKRFEQLLLGCLGRRHDFARAILNGGVDPSRPGPVGTLFATFQEICDNCPSDTAQWTNLHEFAVVLNNKFLQREAACAIIGWMIDEVPPPEINNVLVRDFCRLQPASDPKRKTSQQTDPVVGWKR